jgi:hypothetical protein
MGPEKEEIVALQDDKRELFSTLIAGTEQAAALCTDVLLALMVGGGGSSP